jgi:hypothetical protein
MKLLWPSRASRVRTRARRPRKRTLDARRRDLEGVAVAQLRELVGDALAQRERHAVGMVDEDAQRVPAQHLCEQHLHLRLGRGEAALDIRLQAAHPSLLLTTKKRASARLRNCAGEAPA